MRWDKHKHRICYICRKYITPGRGAYVLVALRERLVHPKCVEERDAKDK